MLRHTLVILTLVAVLVGVPIGLMPSQWMVLTPGGTYEVGPRIRIPDDRRKEMGRLAFTAIYAQDATLAEALAARLSRTSELVPAETVRPPGVSQQQVNETNKRQIDESKPVATVIALRAAGFPDAKLTGKGVEVGATIENMPAHGVLQPGDVIVGVDSAEIHTTTELQEAIRRHAIGDTVRLDLLRGGERQQVTLETRGAAGEPGRAAIGVYISTVDFDVSLPFDVDVDTGTVGGPSAGLMMALGILDAVTDGDLTRGHYVAGTGTLNVDGAIGPIGGAAEKIVAAERDGADVFLVPRDNEDEVRRRARRAQVIPVSRFDDAVRALCALQPAGGAPATPPAPCP